MFQKIRQRILVSCLCLLPTLTFSSEVSIGGDFTLTSQFNQPYSLADARGKVVILFFGFTLCPDVCPTTLSTIQTVLGQLGDKAKHVQPIFISVDPQRDTPEVLKSYLQYFSNDYIGLTGTIENIDEVVKQYQGFYSYMGNITSNQYMVDHTSNLYIVNTMGKVTNVLQYGLPPEAITNVIDNILNKSDT